MKKIKMIGIDIVYLRVENIFLCKTINMQLPVK